MAPIIRGRVIETPTITPPVATLLDAATVTDTIEWLDADAMFESYNCMTTDARVDYCPPDSLGVPVQAALATAAVGGTVAADTYFVTVTALDGAGGETTESNEQTIVTAGATSTITVDWAPVTGAKGYRIYITDGAAGTEKLTDEVGEVDSYIWDGVPAIGAIDPPATNTALATKEFDLLTYANGFKFNVYGGITCKGIGFDQADAHEQVRRVFEANESKGVERALMGTRFILGPDNSDPDADPQWPAATDVTPTPGTAVSVKEGLALLEGYAGSVYAGLPTIHVPRTIGSLLLSELAIKIEAGKGYTNLGSKVAIGAGYEYPSTGPTGAVPAAGTRWMYATGEVTVARSTIVSPEPQMDRETNEVFVLAERTYIAAVDCFTAAVLVEVQ